MLHANPTPFYMRDISVIGFWGTKLLQILKDNQNLFMSLVIMS